MGCSQRRRNILCTLFVALGSPERSTRPLTFDAENSVVYRFALAAAILLVYVIPSPRIAQRCAEAGVEPVGNTPAEFDAWIRGEIEKWAKVVKVAGIKMED